MSDHSAIYTRVSNGTGHRNFSGQWDSQNFFVPGQRDNGTEVHSLSRDKGTTGQAPNLATGRDGPGQPKFEKGRAGTPKTRDGTRDKTGQSTKGCSKTGKRCSKTENIVLKQEKDVLKQENDVQKQQIWSFF